MREQTLREFLETHTQKEAADVIGCTQGAVWQMLKNQRDIRFRLNKRGEPISFYEIKKPKACAAQPAPSSNGRGFYLAPKAM